MCNYILDFSFTIYKDSGFEEVFLLMDKEVEEAICRRNITDGYTLAAWSLLKMSDR